MTYYSYKDIPNGYVYSKLVADFPFHNYWRNNPLSSTSWIDPREAGYRPIRKTVLVDKQPSWEDPNAVYQTSCDLILPKNMFYSENPQGYLTDIFRSR
jgi:hypothetical protein